MIQLMTKAQVKKQNEEMLQWVKEALNGKHGVAITNILLNLKKMCEASEEESQRNMKAEQTNHEDKK